MVDDREKERKLELANKKLELELGDINLRLLRNVGKIISLKWNRDLWNEAKTKFKSIEEEDISNECKEQAAKIFDTFIIINKVYINEIGEGKFACTNEDLNSLEENCKEVLENIDAVNKYYPQIISDSKCSETKEGIKIAWELIPVARKFANIKDKLEQFNDKTTTWQDVESLYNEADSISGSTQLQSKFAENQKMWFFGDITLSVLSFVKEVNEGKDLPSHLFPSTIQELNFLQKIADEFPNLLNWAEKVYSSDEIENKSAKIKEMKEANEQLKSFVQEQRKKLGGTSNRPANNPQNSQDKKKIQDLQSEINSLNQKLAELQSQIESLSEKQNTNSANSTDEQQIQQQITGLQKKKEDTQIELDQKKNHQKQLKNKTNSSNSQSNSQTTNNQNNKFNWLYVVIPGGILLVICGIVIAYLMGKKNKERH
ncbi:hypothetical protein [endosymbiont GvMRE of Glomus versiforme]|uniref:hypothetical protein n=1 Tax=endosymbiont GvMRE of Glomus versiforme TaxID=2039283 RepID=UPI000ECBAB50|nr:hypothetical protein [endosymbiont GvMRE of Glomus versiforme]RHZ36486.1 hypothetical protein GvMRE_I2g511 [endosymbiont GvMRE of Glomus versiforme]